MSMSTTKEDWKFVKELLDNKWGEETRKESIPNGAAYNRLWVCVEVLNEEDEILIIHRHFKAWWRDYFKKHPAMGTVKHVIAAFKRDFPLHYYIQDGYDMYWLICKDFV